MIALVIVLVTLVGVTVFVAAAYRAGACAVDQARAAGDELGVTR